VNPLLKIWYRAEAAAAQALLFCLARTPLPLVLGLASLTARVVFIVAPGRRRVAMENLRLAGICRDTASARRLAWESFRSFAFLVVESVVARRRLTAANWQEHVRWRTSDEVNALLRAPNVGVLVASAHVGNWEVAARAVSQVKPVCVVYRPFNNPYLNRVVHAGRSGEKLRLVSRLDSHPMRFVQALAAGEIVALMIDQHVSDGRVSVDFFGRPAWTTKAVAMLHLTTKVPLLAAFAIRTGPLKYEVHLAGPIRHPRTGDREQDVLEITQALTREIEKIARAFPEQYMWGHRRWKP
jgi:KDO2-lipid IV(A) lauroyltransferase